MKPINERLKKGEHYGDFIAVTEPFTLTKNYFNSRTQKFKPCKYKYVKLKCVKCGAEKQTSLTEVGERKGTRCTCNPMYKRPRNITNTDELDKWFKNLQIETEQQKQAKKLRRA